MYNEIHFFFHKQEIYEDWDYWVKKVNTLKF